MTWLVSVQGKVSAPHQAEIAACWPQGEDKLRFKASIGRGVSSVSHLPSHSLLQRFGFRARAAESQEKSPTNWVRLLCWGGRFQGGSGCVSAK